MSSARPVSSLEPRDPTDTSFQALFELHAARAARILEWKTSTSHASLSQTSAHPWWLWPNLLSLDAPLIAVLWLHLFAASGHIRISPRVTVALALVVWLIYVSDRVLDGLQADSGAHLTARHQFYRAHRTAFVYLLPGVFVITCCVCLGLDSRTLELGALLMLVVAGYLATVHRLRTRWGLRISKEAVVAAVFGVGTFFPVWTHIGRATASMAVGFGFFVLICWLNLVLIEFAEWVGFRDRRSEAPHRSTIAAGKRFPEVCAGVVLVVLLLSRPSASGSERWILPAVALSALALGAVGFYRRELSIHTVRVLADVALLTPAIVLLFLYR